jgi:hypothetical protein
MIKQVFQGTGERAAINRTGQNDRVGTADPGHGRACVIFIFVGRTAVGECNPAISQVDQVCLEIVVAGRVADLKRPFERIEHPPRRRNAAENRYKFGHS